MLVKMASSNLVSNTIVRTNLFFNKFGYRVNIRDIPFGYWLHRCANIDEYISIVDTNYERWQEDTKRYKHQWYRIPKSSLEIDLEKINSLLTLFRKYSDKSEVTYRHESETVSVYTKDLKVAKIFAKTADIDTITQVSLSPDGVKYFKKEPPAKYRAYTTNNKMPAEFKEEFLEYLNRTPDIRPSNAFYEYIHRPNHHYQTWLWDTYFMDYDDEKNLMMMTLMFPSMIGKKYKLEKK